MAMTTIARTNPAIVSGGASRPVQSATGVTVSSDSLSLSRSNAQAAAQPSDLLKQGLKKKSQADRDSRIGRFGIGGFFGGMVGGGILSCVFTPFVGIPLMAAGAASFIFGLVECCKGHHEHKQANALMNAAVKATYSTRSGS